MSTGPAAVATAYFEAIRARDPARIRAVFAPDGELTTAAGTVRGADAIAEFYAGAAFTFDDLEPTPGPLLVDGDRVAVEIELRMGGNTVHVADFFTVAGDRITRLVVYMSAR